MCAAAGRIQLRRLPAHRRDRALLADHEEHREIRSRRRTRNRHLQPGALTRNRSLSFVCDRVWLRVENADTPFTRAAKQGDLLRLPIKHGEGLYVAPEDELRQMEERGQVILRYVDSDGRESESANPNGSMRAIAGVANERFNVFGLMPHPEHAVEPMLGGEDGLKIFQSIAGGAR